MPMLQSTRELKFLLEVLECYKDTRIKAYDITKLTAEPKSSDNVRYINWPRIQYLIGRICVCSGNTDMLKVM